MILGLGLFFYTKVIRSILSLHAPPSFPFPEPKPLFNPYSPSGCGTPAVRFLNSPL